MKPDKNHTPPGFMLAFFRWYCHPALREEIEGDLLEWYQKQIEKYGIKKARLLFLKEVLLLLRPSIIGNASNLLTKIFPDMKKLQWLKLIALNLVVALCIFLPFLPGPYDKLSYGLSGVAQLIGFIGLLLVPIGTCWLIEEIKSLNTQNRRVNNWNSGYFLAIAAMGVFVLASLFFAMALLANIGMSAAIIVLLLLVFAFIKLIPAIKKLRSRQTRSFNATPLYLLSVPLIAFAIRSLFIGPVSDYGRNYAIRQGEKLVHVIESYYDQRGEYPESIENLFYQYHIPKPAIMGIEAFQYERNGNAYNLSFIQWQHFGATEEIVMYNKNDEHNVKGHFASYNARRPHWKYYWLD